MKKYFLTGLFLFATIATLNAQPIDFTQTPKDLNGKPFILETGKPNATLSDICIYALTSLVQTDSNMNGQEKFKLYQLAEKIKDKKTVSLTAEEVTQLKDRVGKVFPPSVVGAVWKIIDPAEKAEEKKE